MLVNKQDLANLAFSIILPTDLSWSSIFVLACPSILIILTALRNLMPDNSGGKLESLFASVRHKEETGAKLIDSVPLCMLYVLYFFCKYLNLLFL